MESKFEKKRLEYENKSNRKAKKSKAQSKTELSPPQQQVQAEKEVDVPSSPNLFEDLINEIPSMKNKHHGKQKIPIKYIDDKARRLTTFSKRKGGVVKKVHELSVLTGSDVLLIISANPSKNVFTYASTKFQPMLNEKKNKDAILSCLEDKTSANESEKNKQDQSTDGEEEESEESSSSDTSDDDQPKKKQKRNTKNKKK